MYYEAIFVLDAGNNLHLFYSNNYANKAWHLERTAGGWKREPLEPVGDPDYQDLVRKGSPWPSFRQAGVEGQHLCTRIGYGVQDQSISYRACLGADGGWTFIRIIEKPSALFYPFVLLNDNEVLRIMNNVNSDTFSLVNQMTGAEREFLAPVEMKLFPSPDPSEGLEQSFGNKRINLVYDQGQWDGTHLIYCIPLERVVNSSASVITERAVCYLLSYQGNSWNAEKILELPYEGGTLSIGDYIHETSLASTVIFWKDRILNTLGTDFFLGKDSVTGKFITEPIPPSYMALFEKLEHSNRRFYRGDAVGAEGSTGFNNFDGNPPG
ncbi:MAG: hypothetical protein HY201_05730, partial [Nitrospirae bacterium]|nr:hypothetical protein [Candidatus Troglogloeales bacterium]